MDFMYAQPGDGRCFSLPKVIDGFDRGSRRGDRFLSTG
jgi:hypothetical protein